MSEILLRVKDAGLPTDAKQGDVILVKPDGATWGDCEIGSPTYQQAQVSYGYRDVTLLMKKGFDFSLNITDPGQIANNEVLMVNRSLWTPALDDSNWKDEVRFNGKDAELSTIGFRQYRRVVTGYIEKPIKEHPHGVHNFWRVVRLPLVNVAKASTLLAPEIDTDPQNPNPNLQFRQFYIDFTKVLPGTFKKFLDDDTRKAGALTANLTEKQFDGLISKREPIPF